MAQLAITGDDNLLSKLENDYDINSKEEFKK